MFEAVALVAILNFGRICNKLLAHPHVAMNVILKFQKKLTGSFCAHKKTWRRTESWRD